MGRGQRDDDDRLDTGACGCPPLGRPPARLAARGGGRLLRDRPVLGRRNAREARFYGTAIALETATFGLALVDVAPALVFALLGVRYALPLALIAGARTVRAPYVLVGG